MANLFFHFVIFWCTKGMVIGPGGLAILNFRLVVRLVGGYNSQILVRWPGAQKAEATMVRAGVVILANEIVR